jgi:uncharacterized membrane protein YccC
LEPSAEIAELAHQAEQLEARIQHLRIGINNLMQISQGQGRPSTPEEQQIAQAELARLEEAVDRFELDLASRLFTWHHLQEPFWQAVRYGGLGLVGGWLLHWLVR